MLFLIFWLTVSQEHVSSVWMIHHLSPNGFPNNQAWPPAIGTFGDLWRLLTKAWGRYHLSPLNESHTNYSGLCCTLLYLPAMWSFFDCDQMQCIIFPVLYKHFNNMLVFKNWVFHSKVLPCIVVVCSLAQPKWVMSVNAKHFNIL